MVLYINEVRICLQVSTPDSSPADHVPQKKRVIPVTSSIESFGDLKPTSPGKSWYNNNNKYLYSAFPYILIRYESWSECI